MERRNESLIVVKQLANKNNFFLLTESALMDVVFIMQTFKSPFRGWGS